ncbi:RagB/SusD family nutrient uptake outer membrane protein [Bacteroides caecicola]|uniref:RagB/SusD family nutrient uptake outer membrane protein n=1 Tax=Bacteroides caecicola TaxID=1462569 RepID=UPI0020132F63|nr:RagB/SusD family nutrient uptake outer membrane protein [Bacteroides caecicola]MCL1625529.1 RagB/SusD family nutrient uptake outer membrane protein [Bacteroides caecicola]
MKKIHLLISSVLCLGLASCFDMNQEPKGELSTSEAFSTTNEIQMYLNMFYQGSVPRSGGGTVNNTAIKTHPSNASSGLAFGDAASDNLLPNEFDSRLSGNTSIANAVEMTDYSAIRNVNFLLQNIGRCEDQESDAFKQCLGEAYYFRAAYYYHLLVNYGGVTWLDTPLDPNTELMARPRNTRTELTNYILTDLDLAIENLNEQSSNATGRVHRDVARALKSEVALFAATWEKYHRAENDKFYDTTLTNAEEQITDWLNQAVKAAEEVMQRDVWQIHNTGDPLTDYRDLFITLDLTGNQEVLWWKQYNAAANIGHNVTYYSCYGGGNKGVSASLVDDYLKRNGELFEGAEKLNAKRTYGVELSPTLRDPRLSQTVFTPGQQIRSENGGAYFEWPPLDRTDYHQNTTGYSLLKYEEFNTTLEASYNEEGRGQAPAIQFRYADILLNYAEALAELDGAANAQRIINALHPLRQRVDMPDVDFDREYNTDADYPFHNLDKYIQAVRRERRVEKAAENARLTDILRWAAADELIVGKYPLGALYTGTNLETEFSDKLTPGDGFWLNSEGYIISANPASYPNGWQFNVNRDYLLPIREEMLGPDGLTSGQWEQNPGW